MRTSSAKAKGRRAVQEVRDLLLSAFPTLTIDDLRVTSSGANGEDLLLSSRAKELIPFSYEVKNQEKINIWSSLKQAESHVSDQRTPLLVFKRNHERLYVVCEFEKFLSHISREPDVHGI